MTGIDYKRVKLASGAKITVANVLPGMTVIDEDAVDRNGRPLDATYPDPAAPTEPAGDQPLPYDQWTNAALDDEIARRNSERTEDDQIVVAPPGNKAELVAALTGDDETHADA